MRVLLDTHALLWWASAGASRLSTTARERIQDASTVVLVSAASAYEVAVKVALGRLDLPDAPERYIPALLERHRFTQLPVDVSHALRAGALPLPPPRPVGP